MKTIWKHELETVGLQAVDMPDHAKILTVQTQYKKPCIWFLCNPKELLRLRIIRTIGTRHEEEDVMGRYIGTYQLHKGAGVFHVFDQGYQL